MKDLFGEETKINEIEQEKLILLHWNSFANENDLPKLLKITDKRRSAIRQRLKEKEFDFQIILDKIRMSPFLLGDNNRGWKIHFDFVVNKNRYIEILEGKYNGRKKSERGIINKDQVKRGIETFFGEE